MDMDEFNIHNWITAPHNVHNYNTFCVLEAHAGRTCFATIQIAGTHLFGFFRAVRRPKFSTRKSFVPPGKVVRPFSGGNYVRFNFRRQPKQIIIDQQSMRKARPKPTQINLFKVQIIIFFFLN